MSLEYWDLVGPRSDPLVEKIELGKDKLEFATLFMEYA